MDNPVQELGEDRAKEPLGLKRAHTDDVREGERIDLLDEEAHIRSGLLIALPNERRVDAVEEANVLIVRAAPLGVARHDARKVPSARCRPVDVVVARRQDALVWYCWRGRRRRRSLATSLAVADEAELLEDGEALLGHLLLEASEVERERHLVGGPERAVARSGYLLLR